MWIDGAEYVQACVESRDYGDAPASYGVAAHKMGATNLYLGSNPDAEGSSAHSIRANGDGNEDDGPPPQAVGAAIPSFAVLQMTDMSYSTTIRTTNQTGTVAKLTGWIDFDKNGSFDADERASVDVPTGSNNINTTLTWPSIPADITLGTTYVRLRFTTDATAALQATGIAPNGEVEDFILPIHMDIPPNSPSISIASAATSLACQSVVFQDNFNDLPPAETNYWGVNRAGALPVRSWTASGGGADTYARFTDWGLGYGTSIYFGDGDVRNVSPSLGSGFSFDAQGKLLTTIDAIALRDSIDDLEASGTIRESHWGVLPVTLSRSFATAAGKTYRLYFSALRETGDFLPGIMRVDAPGGAIHFKAPGGTEGILDYAIDFTATGSSSSISFVNYGHFGPNSSGYCNVMNNAWCTVGGLDNDGKSANELSIDNVKLVEAACATGGIGGYVYQDANLNNTYDMGTETTIPAITVKIYDEKGSPTDFTDDRLVTTQVSFADGHYLFEQLDANASYRVEVDITDPDLPSGLSIGTPNPLSGLVPLVNNVKTANFGLDPAGASGTEDYGDAPASYGDASHSLVSGLQLGTNAPDAELTSQPSFNALGDGYDEDGPPHVVAPSGPAEAARFPVLKLTDTSYTLPYTVTNSTGALAQLYAWIDFDKNGSFEADEATSVAVPTGSVNSAVNLTWSSIPSDIKLGTSFIRVRLTTDAAVSLNTPTGSANSGEVEDYPLAIYQPIAPDSQSIKIVNNASPLVCQQIVFQDNFNDISSSFNWGFYVPGSQEIRNWVRSGGGPDTYADVNTVIPAQQASVYFGNGAVRGIAPDFFNGFSFDSNGHLVSPIEAVALRDVADDFNLGVGMSQWGPEPVRLTRSFSTQAGKTYRLYFKAIPEEGSFAPGLMRVDAPGGSIHFKAPSSTEAIQSYAIEFTATANTSTITFVNYGHVSSDWCDPQTADWCTTGGVQNGTAPNELIIDDVVLAEAACSTGTLSGRVYLDANKNDSYDPAETSINAIKVSLYDQNGTVNDPNDDRLVYTTNSDSSGVYSFSTVDTARTYRIEVDAADTDLPSGAALGTPNPLLGVAVAANATTANQNFGFDVNTTTPVLGVVGEYRFDDCGSGGWQLDSSGNNNAALGAAQLHTENYKNYACTAASNPNWNIEVPHQPNYALASGAVSILLYDHKGVWASARLLDKGWTADQKLTLEMKPSTDWQHGTVSVNLKGNVIDTGETYYTSLGNGSLNDTQWVHAVVSFGPAGMKLYINGVLKGSHAYTGGIESVQGNFRLPGVEGYFDEFYIFNQQPTDAQVSTLYNNLITNKTWDGAARSCNCGGVSADYGDAPATYGTPSHEMVAGVYLGTTAPDSEIAAQPNATATGDDTTGTDDEEGITLPTLTQGQIATITATVTGAGGYLQGWLDWNGDGDFADAGEQIASNLQDNATLDTHATAGTLAFNVPVPANAVTSPTYARFRWSTTIGLDATTAAVNGEVEDYALTVALASAAPVPVIHLPPPTYQVCKSTSVEQLDAFQYATATGSGPAGTPSLTYTPPAGSNRFMVAMLSVERDHSPLATRGDNYETNPGVTFPTVSFGGVPMQMLAHSVDSAGTSSSFADGEISRSYYFYGLHDLSLPSGAQTVQVSGINTPSNVGDDATLAVATFANVASANPISTLASENNQIDRNAPFNIAVSASPIPPTVADQPPGTTSADNLLLAFGTSSKPENLTIGASWTKLAEIPVSNPNGSYATAAGRASSVFTENDGHTLLVQSIKGVSTTQTAIMNSSNNNLQSLSMHVFRLVAHSCDYGDAPASYGEAFHSQSWSRRLGTQRGDAETTTPTAANAVGDDNNGLDDEEGVTLPALTAGQTATINVTVVGSAYLSAWVDWNGDGDFNDALEKIATDLQDTDANGLIPISLTVPVTASSSQTYARFRWSINAGAAATGWASYGEVEDYALTVNAAPSVASCSGYNAKVYNPNTTNTDTSYDGWTQPYAVNYIGTFPYIEFANTVNHLSIYGQWRYGSEITDGVGDDAGYVGSTLTDADWDRSAEFTHTFHPSEAGAYRFSLRMPNYLNDDHIKIYHNGTLIYSLQNAFSLTAQTVILASRTFAAGDVLKVVVVEEDNHNLAINLLVEPLFTSACAFYDYADAPASYGAPSHQIVTDIRLGAAPDAEAAPSTPLDGSGDNTTGTDDEAGVVIPTLTQGQTATLTATVVGTGGYLQGWIDWNGDGDFADAGEQIATNYRDNSTGDTQGATETLAFTVAVPANAVTTTTYARFRWSTTASLDATTPAAANGEVEDYALSISASSGPLAPPTDITVGASRMCGTIGDDKAIGTLNECLAGKVLVGVRHTDRMTAAPNSADGITVGLDLLCASVNTDGTTVSITADGAYTDFPGYDQEGPVTTVTCPAGTVVQRMGGYDRITSGTLPWVSSVMLACRPLIVDSLGRVQVNTSVAATTLLAGNNETNATHTFRGWFGGTDAYDVIKGYRPQNGGEGFDGINVSCAPLQNYDQGDAPTAAGQAKHLVNVGTHYLGTGTADAETSTLNADVVGGSHGTGDDLNRNDDENGVTIPALTPGQTATITATVAGAGGYLQGWIDWNGDGDFADAGEQIATNIQDNLVGDTNNTAGTIAFNVSVPAGAVTTPTYARFRWSTAQNLNMTTTATDGEVEDYALTVTPVGSALSGKVFEDTNYGGGAGRPFGGTAGTAGIMGVRVELYNSTGNFITSITTANGGPYSFASLANGTYYVRVVNNTIRSTRAGSDATERSIQTFRSDGTSAVTNEVGGRKPALVDAAANTTNQTLNTSTFVLSGGGQAQSVQPVTVSGSHITGVDFGFNFSTVININDSGQGSLRQAILNANLLANSMTQPGSNYGLNTALNKEVLVFNIPASGDPQGRTDICGGTSCNITVNSKLPDITAPLIIDGATQPGYTAGTPGIPRIRIAPTAGLDAIGISIAYTATDSTVRGLSITGFRTSSMNRAINVAAARTVVESNYLGVKPDGTADANGQGIMLEYADTATVVIGGTSSTKRNIISGNLHWGIAYDTGATAGTIQNNFIGTNVAGTAALGNQFGGVDLESANDTLILDNVIAGNAGDGLQIGYTNGTILTSGYTIRGNRIGVGINGEAIGNTGPGIMNYGGSSNHQIGGTAASQANIIANNIGGGIKLAANSAGVNNIISGNSIYANGNLGIDLGNNGITINDANDADTGANNLLNFPLIAELSIASGNLTAKGCAPNGATVELFEADVSTGGKATLGDNKLGKSKDYGEGQIYLVSFVEGGASDTDAANCTLAADTDGNNQAGMKAFSVTIPAPAAFVAGDAMTATATLAGTGTSEFSPVFTYNASCSLIVTTTADTDNTANNSGSLRDAIDCANSTPGVDSITFNMPNTETGFTNPDGVANNGNEYWQIALNSQLPSITEGVNIDGRTQTSNKGNTNSGNVAAAATVGADNIALSAVAAPEIEIVGQWFGAGFDIKASNVSIYGLGMRLFDTNIRLDQANTTNILLNALALGVNLVNGSDPGAGQRSNQHIAVNASGVGFVLTNSLLGFNDNKRGIVTGQYNNVSDVSATISGNHFVGVGMTGNTENAAIEILRTQNPNMTISGNRFVGRGATVATDLAVEFNDYGGGNSTCVTCLVENNSISGFHDGVGYFTDASLTGLVINKNRIYSNAEFAVFLGNVQNASVAQNYLHDNGKSGVLINKNSANGNIITQNHTYNNGELGINLAGGNQIDPGGITLNDANDTDSGPNKLFNFPILQQLVISNGNITARGCAPAGSVVEFFEADVSPGGAAVTGANRFGLSLDYGEGQFYLGSMVEGSVADADTGDCAIPAFDGHNNTGMKAFQFSVPTPATVVEGDYLTASATLANTGTSEFGPSIKIISGPPPIGAGSCAATGGSDILFIVDNSGSITELEYADFAQTIQTVGSQLLLNNPKNRIAVAHFGGPSDSLVGGGQYVYIERDFSSAAMLAPIRQFAWGGAYNMSWSADHLAGAIQQMRYALDGQAATTSSYILSPLKETSRNTASPLQIVLMTDAARYLDAVPGDISMLIDPLGSGAEPNDGSFFTVYNQMKAEGVSFSVASFNADPTDIAASAAIASVGGGYAGPIEANTQDPQGSQATPRRYISVTSGFQLTNTQLDELVEGTSICGSSIQGLVFEDPNYGGGAGRPFGTLGTVGIAGATIEVYDQTGNYLASVVSTADGKYSLPNLPDAPYYVRVVDATVNSIRLGSNGSEIPVLTYHSDGLVATATQIGGNQPALADAGVNTGTATLNTTTFLFSGGGLTGKPAQSIQLVTLSGSNVKEVDFGFNFSTVVNTNDAGQGSLRQFLFNNKQLATDSLAQVLPAALAAEYPAGTETSIFMIPATQLTADKALISLTGGALNLERANTTIDGRTQIANIGSGTIVLNASTGNGLNLLATATSSAVRDITVSYSVGSGIVLDDTDNAVIERVSVLNNSQYGVSLINEALNNRIIANTIAHNTWAGIAHLGNGIGNTYSQNSIHDNGGLGIDLGVDGVTVNDDLDVDTGPNKFLNYPVVEAGSSISSNGTKVVAYDFDLDVPSNTHGYRLEFFRNTAVDSSTHGEGEIYLGYVDINHAGGALLNFKGSLNANQTVPANANIAVTLTEKTSPTILGSTSEFSGVKNGSVSVCTDLINGTGAEMTVNENAPVITYLEATDDSGNPITYVISGGADGNQFIVQDPTAGATLDCTLLTFRKPNIVGARSSSLTKALPLIRPGDYEAPVDSGGDNTYDLTLTATVNGQAYERPVTVGVQDINEPPSIINNDLNEVLEGKAGTALNVDAFDPDAGDEEGKGLSYALSGGADRARFKLNAQTGELSFVKEPDFEAPLDAGNDNVYDIDVRVMDDQGLSSVSSLKIAVTDDKLNDGISLQTKVLLQGPYAGSTGLMQDSLRSLGLLPITQPYTADPFNYQGTEQLNLDLATVTGKDAIVDWVLVELRDAAQPNTVIAGKAALVQRDGDVIDATTGSTVLNFKGLAAGNYVVSLRHRNHLGVKTAAAVAFNTTPVVIDFSQTATLVAGAHARLESSSLALLWAGDVTHDARLILIGVGSDTNAILTTVLKAPTNLGLNSSYRLLGYLDTDLNMDGNTLFIGPSNDNNVLLGNVFLFPSNTNKNSNYIVVGGLAN